jgi:hypothetical protein
VPLNIEKKKGDGARVNKRSSFNISLELSDWFLSNRRYTIIETANKKSLEAFIEDYLYILR